MNKLFTIRPLTRQMCRICEGEWRARLLQRVEPVTHVDRVPVKYGSGKPFTMRTLRLLIREFQRLYTLARKLIRQGHYESERKPDRGSPGKAGFQSRTAGASNGSGDGAEPLLQYEAAAS